MTADEQKAKWDALIARFDREEDLLNQRLNIFLIVNGLAGVAIGVPGTGALGRSAIAFVTVLINILWVACSTHTLKTKKRIAEQLQIVSLGDTVTDALTDTLGNHHRLRPSVILGVYLPIILAISWLSATIANLLHLR